MSKIKMEPLESYLTKEGWKRDLERTKKDFKQGKSWLKSAFLLAAAIPSFLSACSNKDIYYGKSWTTYNFQKQANPVVESLTDHRYYRPAFSAVDWDKDGDIDFLTVDSYTGDVFLHINAGEKLYRSVEPIAKIKPSYFGERSGPERAAFSAIDWDKDGDIELLVADINTGDVFLYKKMYGLNNTDIKEFDVVKEPIDRPGERLDWKPKSIAKVPVYDSSIGRGVDWFQNGTAFSAADWDNDGDTDLIVADTVSAEVFLCTNIDGKFYQSKEPIAEVVKSYMEGTSIAAVDWDKDGKMDILAMDVETGNIYLHKNIGKQHQVQK